MGWFSKKVVTGIDRVAKVAESFKAQIADLDLGITEIDEATEKNLKRVTAAENRLVRLREDVHTENGFLAVSKELATNLKGNISKLFIIE